MPHRFNRASKMVRPAVREVISGYSSDHDMLQSHASGGFGHSRRLIGFERKRAGGGDCAKTARASAAVAGNHEGGRAFAPAFPVIGTHGALANCVELQLLQ